MADVRDRLLVLALVDALARVHTDLVRLDAHLADVGRLLGAATEGGVGVVEDEGGAGEDVHG